MSDDDDAEIQIGGKIDLISLDIQANGLCFGSGSGEMEMTLKTDGEPIMKIKVHKLSFQGTKSVTDPDKYPGSDEK